MPTDSPKQGNKDRFTQRLLTEPNIFSDCQGVIEDEVLEYFDHLPCEMKMLVNSGMVD